MLEIAIGQTLPRSHYILELNFSSFLFLFRQKDNLLVLANDHYVIFRQAVAYLVNCYNFLPISYYAKGLCYFVSIIQLVEANSQNRLS